ncbi:MAG: phosphonate metabolism protein/1,5-bisphosphokinase (PRPP-forming) PhnN [Pseudomonadota bacterium]
MRRGTLHLVVGSSGAGKDTLIDAARAARPDILFPRRVITRPGEAGGEDHEGVSQAEFARREAAGEFLLSWRAHGLAYGVPAEAGAALAGGRDVLVNVSRAVIAQARARWTPLRVIFVSAPPAVLARRLAARGRESEADIAARLRRAGDAAPRGADVTLIDNAGEIAAARAAFLSALAPARRATA